MKKPENNPAQNYLTQQALEGADFFKKGDFSAASLPKGFIFDFKNPIDEIKDYKNSLNVGKEGTLALGADSGAAHGLQQQFLTDKFARDRMQNYQDNISNAAGTVRNTLAQAAGAKSQNDEAVMRGLQQMYSDMSKSPKNGWLGGLLNAGAQIGTSLITKF